MRALFLSFLFLIFSITQLNAQWFVQNTSYTNTFYGVHFIDSNTGWICGNGGLILHTTNHGINWNAQLSGTNITLFDIKFVSTQIGWAIGISGIILYTNDGGATWNTQESGVTNTLFSISAIDSEYCWISGSQGILLNTSNGGYTWNFQHQFPGIDRTIAHFINRNIGWVGGHSNPPIVARSIYKTTNGGVGWSLQPSSGGQLIELFFLDENNGWATGEPSRLQITTNGGNNWFSKTFSQESLYSSSAFLLKANTGWISSYYVGTYIWFTSDWGTSWTLQYISPYGYTSRIYDMYFIAQKYGWAVGLNGLIIHTDNGGGVFPTAPSLIIPESNQQLVSDTIKFVWSSVTPQITGYELYLSTDSLFSNEIDTLITDTTITLMNLEINTKYYWKVKAQNEIGWGDESQVSTFTTVLTDVEETKVLPFEFALSQNYPNPFNPSTNIQYAISSRQLVTLKVYDVLGKEVAILVNEEKPAGSFNVEFNASHIASGIYYYQLRAGEFIKTKKMILLR